jgi:glucose/arabinose dehydrogenase
MKRQACADMGVHSHRDGARAGVPASTPHEPILNGRIAVAAIALVLSAMAPWVLFFGGGSLALSSPNSLATGGVAPGSQPVDIATGLFIPWSVAFVDDVALVSERNTGEIFAFRPEEKPRSIGRVPNVSARLDGGLLGLAVLNKNGAVWVYAYHSTTKENRIVRMPYREGALGDPEILLAGLAGGRGHNGGRIAFGPDGMLYAAVGESQIPALSQDANALGGKILRMTPDGGVPADNPTKGSLVYALGLRNPQGLAWDDGGGLWATDFGDKAWDELNRIEPGKNYGWPVVEGRGGNPDYVDPVVQWRPQDAGPSGLTYVNGTFFIAGLTGQRVWSVTFDSNGSPIMQAYYTGTYGRIRDVLQGHDGKLWFVTNNTDGRRVTPRAGDDRILAVPLAPAPPL